MVAVNRAVFVFVAMFFWIAGSQAAQEVSPPPTMRMPMKRMPATSQPVPETPQAQIVNPEALPLELQVSHLREQLEAVKREFTMQLQAARREVQDLQARYQRHGHEYVGLGNVYGLPADQFDTKSIRYEGTVLLGGKGIPGNQGPIYRSPYRTSVPIE